MHNTFKEFVVIQHRSDFPFNNISEKVWHWVMYLLVTVVAAITSFMLQVWKQMQHMTYVFLERGLFTLGRGNSVSNVWHVSDHGS
jgi:hypothetical protein